MEKINLCHYGCGQEAKFIITKKNINCCSKNYSSCPENRKKNSEGLKKDHANNPKNYSNRKNHGMSSPEWKIKNPEKVKQAIEKQKKTYKEGIDNGRINLKKGFKHSLETRQKISKKAKENNNGYVKTKYYEIFCKNDNEVVKVQGSWEFKYAQYLNKNNILWSKKFSPIKYEFNELIHNYYPDFYLVKHNKYVEIKGYYWKSKDGRVDDKRKMELVINQNSNIVIDILLKKDLINLGIDLKKIEFVDDNDKKNFIKQKEIKKIKQFEDNLIKKYEIVKKIKIKNEKEKKIHNDEKFNIEKVINAVNIDFSKLGWVEKISKLIDKKPQHINKWMKKYLPEFYEEKCFKRKSFKNK